MKKFLTVFVAALGALCLVSCDKESAEKIDAKQNLLDRLKKEPTVYRDISIQSEAMGRTMKYSIWLPAGYSKDEHYPVLWLLHGMGDDQNGWLDKGALNRIATDYTAKGGCKMIIVTPDGLTSFYTGNWERYFYDELMPAVEMDFAITADARHRAVAGLSMGGFGSLYHAIAHPDMYCCAYACSPATGDILKNMIEAMEDTSKLPSITIETGSEDYTVGSQPKDFHDFLVEKGIEHEWILRSGTHDWKFWQECLPKVLDKAGQSFNK